MRKAFVVVVYSGGMPLFVPGTYGDSAPAEHFHCLLYQYTVKGGPGKEHLDKVEARILSA